MRRISIHILLPFLLFGFLTKAVFGETTDLVSATIKIGVCGDGVAEGVEECDNEDLLGKTCYNLGFGGGTVTCDPSCSLDTSLCIPRPPEPPPSDDDNDDDDDDNDDNEISRTIQSIFNPFEDLVSLLSMPDFLKVFDADSDGKISTNELFYSAKIWFDNWKSFLAGVDTTGDLSGLVCDLNSDQRCNLVDFSILMYYMDRE